MYITLVRNVPLGVTKSRKQQVWCSYMNWHVCVCLWNNQVFVSRTYCLLKLLLSDWSIATCNRKVVEGRAWEWKGGFQFKKKTLDVGATKHFLAILYLKFQSANKYISNLMKTRFLHENYCVIFYGLTLHSNVLYFICMSPNHFHFVCWT